MKGVDVLFLSTISYTSLQLIANIAKYSSKVPGLCTLLGESSGRFSEESVREIISGTAAASSTKGNPIVLSVEDLQEILLKAA